MCKIRRGNIHLLSLVKRPISVGIVPDKPFQTRYNNSAVDKWRNKRTKNQYQVIDSARSATTEGRTHRDWKGPQFPMEARLPSHYCQVSLELNQKQEGNVGKQRKLAQYDEQTRGTKTNLGSIKSQSRKEENL